MMSVRCYVMGCKSVYETSKEKTYFFQPIDQKTVKLWSEFIGRKDVALNLNHSVCHKHFEDADVIKTLVKQYKSCHVNDGPPLHQKFHVKLAFGAVPKLLTGKPMETEETPRPPLPEVKKTVQHPQQQLLLGRQKKIISYSKDATKRPVLVDKTAVHLERSGAVQTLQNVSPAAQKITNHQPVTIISNSAIVQQQTPPPVVLLIQTTANNDTAEEFRKILSTTQRYIMNLKDVTLPLSWFWQEGSLKEQEFICSKFKWLDENKFEYTKSVIIDGGTRTLRFFVRGQQVFDEKLKYQFSTLKELIDCLRFYDTIPECMGFSNPKSIEIFASSNLQAKSSSCETRSKNCLLLGMSKNSTCRNCIKDDTHFKVNVPEQTSNESKNPCNMQQCKVASEPPVTHLDIGENLDEILEQPKVLSVHLDHSYGVRTSRPVWNKSPIETSNVSDNNENDKKDLEMAKRFLKNEATRTKMLRKQLNRQIKTIRESKDMARAILKASKKLQEKMEKKRISEKPIRPKKSFLLTPCNQCGRMVRVVRMKLHLKIHNGFKPHNCESCSRSFANKSSLREHVRFHHLGAPKPYMCSGCGITFGNKAMLKIHEMTHTDEKPFECSICDKKYRSKANLRIHKRSHTGEKPYICKVCGKSYLHCHSMKKHFRRHHENLGPDGTIDPSIGYVWKKKGTSTGGKRLHSCTICSKSYFDKNSLKIHIKRYHEPGGSDSAIDPITGRRIRKVIPIHRCEFCQKEFCRVLAFERHRSTHTGDAVAVNCTQPNCDFTYSTLKQLKDHLVAQHPDSVFNCDLCEKVFLAKLNLDRHQAVHDPSLGFQCSYCPLRSTTMSSLVKHEKIHTREKMHQS